MYQNYIFDLYGTLVDINTDEESSYLWKILSQIYGYYGANYTPNKLRKAYLNMCMKEVEACGVKNKTIFPEIQLEDVFMGLFKKKNVTVSMEEIRTIGLTFRAISTKFLKLYDGVTDLLESLRAANKKIFVLSNAQAMFTVPEMRSLDLLDKFDGIMISSDAGICKPDENFFKLLLERYNLDPAETIMIGNDKIADITGANNAGIDSLYIHSDISPALSYTDGRDIPATYKIMDGDFSKIKELILKEPSSDTSDE